MHVSMENATSAKEVLRVWERALLLLPALAGLGSGLILLFTPAWFASLVQFPPKNLYVYQLAGAATLGYGVALGIGLLQKEWLPLRFPLIGMLAFSLALFYASAVSLPEPEAVPSLFVVLVASLLFIGIAGLLLLRHRGVLRSELRKARGLLRAFLIIGGISAGIFGLVPLFLPNVFVPLFHFEAGTAVIARFAGAACLGYALLSLQVLQGIDRRELALTATMAGVFNGASAIMSIPVLLMGTVFLLPWIIVPVGLSALIVSLLILRAALIQGQEERPTH